MRVGRLALLLAVSASCGVPPPQPPRMSQLAIEAPVMVLTSVGQVVQFKAVATMTNGERRDQTSAATWKSLDPSVATVSGGAVTAVSGGPATITATAGDFSAQVAVSVRVLNPDHWKYLGAITAAGRSPNINTEQILVDPNDERVWYVTTAGSTDGADDRGLYVTRDAGATWTRAVVGFATLPVLDPRDSDTVYYSAGDTLYRSRDRGVTWSSVTHFGQPVGALVVSTFEPGAIFAGTENGTPEGGAYVSRDDGGTWTWYSFHAGSNLICWDITEDPSTGIVYTPTEIANHPNPYHPPFLRSLDRGVSWENVAGTLPWHALRVIVHPTTGDVYTLTEGAGVYRSADHGETWTFLNNNFYLELIVDPRNPARFFGGNHTYGGHSGGAFVSTDTAQHFSPFGLAGRVVGALRLNGSSTRLYAAAYGSGIYVRELDQ